MEETSIYGELHRFRFFNPVYFGDVGLPVVQLNCTMEAMLITINA